MGNVLQVHSSLVENPPPTWLDQNVTKNETAEGNDIKLHLPIQLERHQFNFLLLPVWAHALQNGNATQCLPHGGLFLCGINFFTSSGVCLDMNF